MYEIDQTYLAYELAYRAERLTGRRATEAHHRPALAGEIRARRTARRGTTR